MDKQTKNKQNKEQDDLITNRKLKTPLKKQESVNIELPNGFTVGLQSTVYDVESLILLAYWGWDIFKQEINNSKGRGSYTG